MELIIAALLKFVDGQEDDINRGYSQLQRLRSSALCRNCGI
jgi:hypothetical protein